MDHVDRARRQTPKGIFSRAALVPGRIPLFPIASCRYGQKAQSSCSGSGSVIEYVNSLLPFRAGTKNNHNT